MQEPATHHLATLGRHTEPRKYRKGSRVLPSDAAAITGQGVTR